MTARIVVQEHRSRFFKGDTMLAAILGRLPLVPHEMKIIHPRVLYLQRSYNAAEISPPSRWPDGGG